MKRINICFHIDNISNCGGTEKVTTQIASLLLENYDIYNVSILSTWCLKEKKPFFSGNSKIKYDRLYSKKNNNKLNYFKTVKKIRKYLKDNKIDVLVGVDTILSVFDIPAVNNSECKYIAWEHFNYNYNLGVKLRSFGRKLSMKKADKVVVLTDKDKKYFSEKIGFNNKLVRIYNPFIVNKTINKYDNNSKIIMSSGRLTLQKGFDILIDVANELSKYTKDFEWIILGDGEDKQLLSNKIKQLKLEDNVKLIGRVNNVDEYYKKSRLFVLTSRFEGLCLVGLEAKANKLPIISFDFDCGPSEIIDDGVNGYLIENGNINEMAKKIYELLKNKEKCLQFSNKSQEKMELFSERKIAEEWNNLIIKVIKYDEK